jgi:hypothetical protein
MEVSNLNLLTEENQGKIPESTNSALVSDLGT